MFKRALIVVLALLTCAMASAAFAGSIAKPGAVSAGLVWGGGPAPAPPPTGIIRRALFNRASYAFPTSYPSPVNRYDWSHWFEWLGGQD
jgi:hypothetical protein